MRFLKMFFALLVLGLAAYCFWPRTPSLKGFQPNRMAGLQAGIWKAASEKLQYELVLPFYQVYEGEYHLPPAASLLMAIDSARALHSFHRARDAADQEAALVPLERVFTRLRDETGAAFDPPLAARTELAVWGLRTDPNRQADLTVAWSELLGLLYGQPSREAVPAARTFVSASQLADAGKWENARTLAGDAWHQVQQLGEKNSPAR